MMPLAAKNNLDELYARHRLLQEEAERLEAQSDRLGEEGDSGESGQIGEAVTRRWIIDVQSNALRVEATRLSASISDILERDLQR